MIILHVFTFEKDQIFQEFPMFSYSFLRDLAYLDRVVKIQNGRHIDTRQYLLQLKLKLFIPNCSLKPLGRCLHLEQTALLAVQTNLYDIAL